MTNGSKVSSHPSPYNGLAQDSPTSSKSPSISSSTTATAVTSPCNDRDSIKRRLESLTDEEVIQRNLQELMDKKNREERKANGRLVAVILASLVIFLAIYHAWIRNSGKLAGLLVPVVIMVSFGGLVVILAKRDRAKRVMFEKYLEEIAQKKLEAKKSKIHKKSHERNSSNETIVHYVNEIDKDPQANTTTQQQLATSGATFKSKDHRKHRKHRNAGGDGSSIDSSSSSSSKNRSHYATKDLRIKRPSIRQKLFRQSGLYHITTSGKTGTGAAAHNTTHSLVQAVINTPALQPMATHAVIDVSGRTLIDKKRKRLQRLDAMQVPSMVRMGSV